MVGITFLNLVTRLLPFHFCRRQILPGKPKVIHDRSDRPARGLPPAKQHHHAGELDHLQPLIRCRNPTQRRPELLLRRLVADN